MSNAATLLHDRETAAEAAFQAYEFDLSISDTSGWDDIHTDEWTRLCYAESEADEERLRIALTVRFLPESAEPAEVFALDLQHGQEIGKPGSASKTATYNHAFEIAFSVPGSTCPNGTDVTAAQLIAALHERIRDLSHSEDELLEAIGAPYDTYEEQK